MDLLASIHAASSGLKAQAGRVKLAAENLANAQSTGSRPGADPYRRKVATFRPVTDRDTGVSTVQLGRVHLDQTAFPMRVEPGHPAADAQGRVKLPNVDPLVEAVDLRAAQRSYEANLNVIGAARRMLTRTIDLLRA